MRSYKNVTSFHLKNVHFPTLETCYSYHTSLKIKTDQSVSFQKASAITFFDNRYYVSTSKSYMLYHFILHHHVKNLSFCYLSHMRARMLSKFVNSTIPGQNIQCTRVSCKSVTFSTVKSEHVNGDFNVTRKNVVNAVRDFVIPHVSPRPSSSVEPNNFASQCYSDSFKCPKGMTCKIVCFCQDSNSVNSNYCRGCRGKKKNKTMFNGFNDQYIKNTCFVATIFGSFYSF